MMMLYEKGGAALTGGECPDAEQISERVKLFPDGKYRWRYDMSLFKNPTIFILVGKIFFFIMLGIFAFVTLIDALDGNGFIEAVKNNFKVFSIIFLVMFGIFIIAYLIYAAMMGGKYSVEFEMDEKGINHRQVEAQAKKARRLAKAAAMSGRPGLGVSASRTEMYSDFSKIKKVKVYPRRHLIKVNGTFDHNQVYACADDFEFVRDFIAANCKAAQ